MLPSSFDEAESPLHHVSENMIKEGEICSPARDGQRSTPLGLLVIQRGTHAYKRCTVSPNVVFVRAELTAFSRNSLQLFLGGCVGISNVHEKPFLSNAHPIVLSNNFIANITVFESVEDD